MLTVIRKYHKSYNRVREGNFLLNDLTGFNLCGKTVGLIGTGKIGLLTGKILSKGFGCTVIAYDPYPNAAAKDYGIVYVDLGELLARSDIISLHCPLTNGTAHIMNDEAFSQTKKGVVLINTSRGGLIDTYALIRYVRPPLPFRSFLMQNIKKCLEKWPCLCCWSWRLRTRIQLLFRGFQRQVDSRWWLCSSSFFL